MVRVDSFCIDSTEVTNAQYQEFLAKPKGPSDAPDADPDEGG